MIDVQPGMPVDDLKELFHTAGQQPVVITYADDVVASAIVEADVPVVHHMGSTAVLRVSIIMYSCIAQVGFDDACQVLRRAVIDDDELPVRIRLADDALNGFLQVASFV